MPICIGHFCERALKLVALLRKEICNLRHPMHLRHPVASHSVLHTWSYLSLRSDVTSPMFGLFICVTWKTSWTDDMRTWIMCYISVRRVHKCHLTSSYHLWTTFFKWHIYSGDAVFTPVMSCTDVNNAHVSRMSESRHAYEWDTKHIWMCASRHRLWRRAQM